jgi:hypothetical protein
MFSFSNNDMKFLLSFIMIILLCSSCEVVNDQQKGEKIVKDYLGENLNDPSSYESVSFGNLSPVHFSYEISDPEGIKLQRQNVIFDSVSITYSDKANKPFISKSNKKKYALLENVYRKKADSLAKLIKMKSDKWVPTVKCYTIEHKYRAKNGYGALTLHEASFMLDSGLTSVFSISENEDN